MNKMSNTSSVVVVASCMIDYMVYAPQLPKPGETIRGTKLITTFGGKGANQCVAAAKLGTKTAIIAKVGDDAKGKEYIDHLTLLGVNTHRMCITPHCASGVAQIIIAESGENQIVIVPGANNSLSKEDIIDSKHVILQADVLLCQLETSADAAIAALELCKGISIVNGAPAIHEYNSKLLTLPTIFCVNESEAEVFSGVPVASMEGAKKAATVLLKKGCNTVIITLGSNGAMYMSQKDQLLVHVPCPIVKCVDTSGAGDAFLGALAHVLAKDKNVELSQAISIACFVASDSTTRPGTQISYPDSSILKKISNML